MSDSYQVVLDIFRKILDQADPESLVLVRAILDNKKHPTKVECECGNTITVTIQHVLDTDHACCPECNVGTTSHHVYFDARFDDMYTDALAIAKKIIFENLI